MSEIFEKVFFYKNFSVWMQNGKVHNKTFALHKEELLNDEVRTKHLKKLKKENELLKKQLVRSGRSRTSLNSRLNEIDELASDSDYEENARIIFMEHSTIHGIRDYYISRKSCIKYTWLVILICAALGSLYGITSIIMEYVQRPYFISYFVQEAGFNVTLPDAVICPFNRFNKSYLQELNVSEGLAQYLELSYPSSVSHSFQLSEWNKLVLKLDTYHEELQVLLEKVGNISYKQFLKQAGIDCKAFFENQSLCSDVQEIMTSAGKCFRVPGGIQAGDGFGYGTQIVIKLPKHLYHAGVNQMLNDGIVVKLVEKGRGVDHDLTFIPSGVHAIMPLKAIKYEFKNDPPRYNCMEKEDATYSRVWCYETCITEAAELACNCSLAASQRQRVSAICTTNQFYKCFAKILFDETKYYERQDLCKKQCRHPCSYWQYDKTVSYARFPSEQAKAFVKEEEEWNSLKNTIILEIYFTSMDYTVIKHLTAFTFSSFVAQIGGQISLWIGGSIISIIQLIIYIFLGGYSSIVRRKKCHSRRKSETRNSDNHIRNIYKEEERIDIPGAQI